VGAEDLDEVVDEEEIKGVLLALADTAYVPNAAKSNLIVQVKNVPQLNVLNVGIQ